tara:strand:- start:187 stop:690 length:504 start_codon:yes stop_codon:yes gene_type:complete
VTDIDLEPNASSKSKNWLFHRKKELPNVLISIMMGARLEARRRLEGCMDASLNVLGEPLDTCSCDPMTGWYRDGNCNTDSSDRGSHTVCCVVTEDFLNFALSKGNDLITPMKAHGFPGLKPGDSWCVCAQTWLDAVNNGTACPIDMEATHQKALEIIPLSLLEAHAI